MKKKINALLQYLKIFDTGPKQQQDLTIREKDRIHYLEKMSMKSTNLATAQQVAPRKEYIEASKNRIFDKLMENQKSFEHQRVAYRSNPKKVRTWIASPVFSIILIIVLGFGFVGSVQAADQALPGEMLYMLDISIEETQLLLAFDDVDRVQLRLGFAAERLQEANHKFGEGDNENALLALESYEQQMREITGLVLNANDQIKTVLVGMVAESHTENSEILIGLIKTTPPEAEDGIQEAIGASEHAIIDITEIPEAAALEIEINTTSKFAADDPKDISDTEEFIPTEDEQTTDPENGDYLPPGIIDNPSHDEDLPPGLEDKEKPPGLKEKDNKKN